MRSIGYSAATEKSTKKSARFETFTARGSNFTIHGGVLDRG
jgi:hypothetical protein